MEGHGKNRTVLRLLSSSGLTESIGIISSTLLDLVSFASRYRIWVTQKTVTTIQRVIKGLHNHTQHMRQKQLSIFLSTMIYAEEKTDWEAIYENVISDYLQVVKISGDVWFHLHVFQVFSS